MKRCMPDKTVCMWRERGRERERKCRGGASADAAM